MINIYFIHELEEDKNYFLPFFKEFDHSIINLQFHGTDQKSSKDQLAIIIIKKISDLEKIESSLSRRLYLAVSLNDFDGEENLVYAALLSGTFTHSIMLLWLVNA